MLFTFITPLLFVLLYFILNAIIRKNSGRKHWRALFITFFGILTLYLGINRIYHTLELHNLEDRSDVLKEVLDNMNEKVFQKKGLFWSCERFGMWLECKITDPNCKTLILKIFKLIWSPRIILSEEL